MTKNRQDIYAEKIRILTALGIIAYEKNRFAQSHKIMQRVLSADSKNQTALTVLGNIYLKKGKTKDALCYYKKAYKLNKKNVSNLLNLGNAFYELKKYKKSIDNAKKAVVLDSKNFSAYILLGNSFLQSGKYQEALTSFKDALKINKKDDWLHNYLSQTYQKIYMLKESAKHGFMAVKISPEDQSHALNFGYLLYEICDAGLYKTAKNYALKWKKISGKNDVANHMITAILGEQKKHDNQKYVKKVFDVFADEFDITLKGLKYKVPEIINQNLNNIYGKKYPQNLQILDVGCGTGLCGKFLKKYAKKGALLGVDLSEQMLKNATKNNYYDKLFCADVSAFLNAQNFSFNLIIGADVFTYFRELEKVFLSIANSLETNGKFLFSVSQNYINNQDSFLHISGRYLHSKKYIEKCLKKSGLSLINYSIENLRKEGTKWVKGFVFLAEKKPL